MSYATKCMVLGGALILAAAGTATAAPGPYKAPSARGSWAAELVAPTVVRSAPKPRARVVMRLSPVGPIGGDETAMMITGSRRINGTVWVRVLLPKRPNGRQGWMLADHARIARRTTRITIDTRRRKLVLYRGRRAILRQTVAIGRPGTPTPRGLAAVAETVNTNLPSSYLGPRVLVLTSHSETISEFRGGKGRVAIHGTDRPGLLGQRVSLGCIRVTNRAVLKLARLAPPGTPVRVR